MRAWEGSGARSPGRPAAGEWPGASESTCVAGSSAHPAARGGEPISGSGSTCTIPFSISSGLRGSPATGVSPIPRCVPPPAGGPSALENLSGSSLGRSALNCSESVPACGLALVSVENQPTSVSTRFEGPDIPVAAFPAPLGASVRVAASFISPLDAAAAGASIVGLNTVAPLSAVADSRAPVGATVDDGPSAFEDEVADRLDDDAGELRSAVAGSCGGSGCLAGDPEIVGSWSGVMSMCHRTASGGSAPQIGSSRDSAGSCLDAVSRNGHSRDWLTVGVSPSCDRPMAASRPLLSPAGDASAMPAPPAVPADGDADRTDLPCSRTPSPAWSSVLRRRRSPSAARSRLRNPPVRSSWTCGASSGRRLMAPASLHNCYEAACGTRECWPSRPDPRAGSS